MLLFYTVLFLRYGEGVEDETVARMEQSLGWNSC
jgi:hypothetical protein